MLHRSNVCKPVIAYYQTVYGMFKILTRNHVGGEVVVCTNSGLTIHVTGAMMLSRTDVHVTDSMVSFRTDDSRLTIHVTGAMMLSRTDVHVTDAMMSSRTDDSRDIVQD
ncbi:hypothetical protein EVAR_7843_1 [Eumeta japonica]|uniref:Uncharacterized protein n=1 Tax=Eumeta variegata TaxID=151549 RepID=A0A4C1TV26_EUMVA|nr:hypothetical protein EVAR_7843_1 [Eumeta japonica]